MAGHSQFKNIMYRKGAQDAKRAKMFAKISREIIVAAKSGSPDPTTNPRLRSAISAARNINMPKDNIDRALKKALGAGDSDNFEEIRYEGYGANGVAVIIECLTDNRNRTASEVRSILTKYGGNLGESGSVSFSFQKLGLFLYEKKQLKFDQVFEYAVENGADNVEEIEGYFEITCSVDNFANLRDGLYKNFGEPEESKVFWHPVNTVECDEQSLQTIQKMIDILEDNDDVQNVYTNILLSKN